MEGGGGAGWPAAFTITSTNKTTASIVSHLLVPFDSGMSQEHHLHRPCAVVRVSVLCVSEPDLIHTDRRKEGTAIGHRHHGGSCDKFPERYKSLDNVRTAKLEGVRRKDRRRRKIRAMSLLVRLCTSNQPSLPGRRSLGRGADDCSLVTTTTQPALGQLCNQSAWTIDFCGSIKRLLDIGLSLI